jgi:IS5 family transposase
MVYRHGTIFPAPVQDPPIVAELEAIFEALPDEQLLKALTPERRFGRPRVQADILWHCHIARYALGLPSVSALIRTLQDNPFIARACGIDAANQIPSQPTFSRFSSKLAEYPVNVLVKDVMREMTREFYRTLPEFGKSVSIDSTDIKAWSNKGKKPHTDPDASWAVKSSIGNLKKFWLGYKAHLLVDNYYELPIALSITSANVHDIRGASRVLRQARVATSMFHPNYVMADAGYSSNELRNLIKRQYRAEPIVKAKRSDKAIDLETPAWKSLYDKRVAVERVFSRLKGYRSLNQVTVRRIAKVTVHCFLAVIVLQAQALATATRVSVRKVA